MLKDSRICADIATSDLERARQFYKELLELVIEYEDPGRGVNYRAGQTTMLNLCHPAAL